MSAVSFEQKISFEHNEWVKLGKHSNCSDHRFSCCGRVMMDQGSGLKYLDAILMRASVGISAYPSLKALAA